MTSFTVKPGFLSSFTVKPGFVTSFTMKHERQLHKAQLPLNCLQRQVPLAWIEITPQGKTIIHSRWQHADGGATRLSSMDKSDESDCSRWRDEYLYCLMDDSDYSQSPHNLSTPFFAPTYSVDESECSRWRAREDDFHRGYQGEESRVNSYEYSKSNDETDESRGFFTLAIPQPASTRYFQPEEINESEQSWQQNTDEEESCYRLYGRQRVQPVFSLRLAHTILWTNER